MVDTQYVLAAASPSPPSENNQKFNWEYCNFLMKIWKKTRCLRLMQFWGWFWIFYPKEFLHSVPNFVCDKMTFVKTSRGTVSTWRFCSRGRPSWRRWDSMRTRASSPKAPAMEVMARHALDSSTVSYPTLSSFIRISWLDETISLIITNHCYH